MPNSGGSREPFSVFKNEKTVATERPADATPSSGSRGLFSMAQTEKQAATEKPTDAALASTSSGFGVTPNFEMPQNPSPFGFSQSFANSSFGNSQPFSAFGKVAENEKKTTSLFGPK